MRRAQKCLYLKESVHIVWLYIATTKHRPNRKRINGEEEKTTHYNCNGFNH